MGQKRRDPAILTEPGAVERLNRFYARFDNTDFRNEQNYIKEQLVGTVDEEAFVLPEEHVRKVLKGIKVNKAPGPDKLSGNLLKQCKDSLFYIIHYIFELSLSTCTYPSSWKIGEIVPVPKKDLPQVINDLRPVTLTSILSKCLERVGLALLMPHVKDNFDPLQFAYILGRSTDDAI